MEKPRRSSGDSDVALQPPPPALDLMVEGAADAMLSTSPEECVVWANPAAARLWGYPSPQDLIGVGFLDLIIPGHRSRARKDLDRLRNLKAYLTFYLALRKDGEAVPVEMSSALLEAGDGTDPVCVVWIARDARVSERRNKEILGTAEKELQRIAMELHDGACSSLCGIACMAEALEKAMSAKGATDADAVGEIGRLLRESITEIRGVIHGISPVVGTEKGFCPSLARLANWVEQRHRISCRFECSEPVSLDIEKSTHIFRIAQEAIRNAITHGKARNILMGLHPDGNAWLLSIQDDGVGFSETQAVSPGMGLAIMNYRGRLINAGVSVKNRPEGGVAMTCRFLA